MLHGYPRLDKYNVWVIIVMAFLRIEFYPNGDDGPVKAFLDHLAFERPRGYAKVALDIEVLGAEGIRSKQVSVRNLGNGLWELRRRFEGIQYRVFFCVGNGILWLLHAIEKRSRKTPQDELRVAKTRMKRVML